MNEPRDTPDSSEPRHPIRVVSTRTGVAPTTLRAWERRYGVVSPDRSEGGQRLYSDDDIHRLLLLRRLTDAGRAISQVAELDDASLEALDAEDRAARREVGGPVPDVAAPGARTALEQALEAVAALDANALESGLRRSVLSLGASAFVDDLVAPLLREIGDRWSRGELRPAHEHVATVVVERVLSWMIEPVGNASAGAPVLVVGTLSGEAHSLGALLAAATAAAQGWRVTFLGRDLPAEEVALAADRLGARAVGVSVVNPLDLDGIPEQLRALLSRLGDEVPVVVGGASAEALVRQVTDRRLRAVRDMTALRVVLEALAV
jgi:MerR family transcriptional regulator, light-induced transcriptional regulator